MQIKDGFEINDAASGLKITIVRGINLDRLHIEIVGEPNVLNRDFFFDREGEFDGTGSEVCEDPSRPKTWSSERES